MALLDIFKKNKDKKEFASVPMKRDSGVAKPVSIKKKSFKGNAWKVLVFPHVTEKATDLEKDNKYIFRVFKIANKIEIKKAVESLYGVNVEDVAIINIPRKKRRAGRQREGWRRGYKKAIVKIQKDQKIEIMPR